MSKAHMGRSTKLLGTQGDGMVKTGVTRRPQHRDADEPGYQEPQGLSSGPSHPLGMAAGCSTLPHISGERIKPGQLTVGGSSEEQEEQQQKQGPLHPRVAPGTWRRKRLL